MVLSLKVVGVHLVVALANKLNIRTKTARRDVCGDQDGRATSFEFSKDPVTLSSEQNISICIVLKPSDLLFFVTMNCQSRPSVRPKIFCDVVGNSFCTNKYKNLGIFSAYLVEVLDELGSFFEIATNFNNLLNIVIGCQVHRPDVNLNGIFQKVLICFQ